MNFLYHCGHIILILTLLAFAAYEAFGIWAVIKFYPLVKLCNNDMIQAFIYSSLIYTVIRLFIFHYHVKLFKKHENFYNNITLFVIQFICEAFLFCYGLYQTGYIDKYCLKSNRSFNNQKLSKTTVFIFSELSVLLNFCFTLITLSLPFLVCCAKYLKGDNKEKETNEFREERQNLLQYSNQDRDVI